MRTPRLSTFAPTFLFLILPIALLVAPGLFSAHAAAEECEGAACAQITVTFDEAKQQFLVRNNSSDRWVRVGASNLAASAVACLPPSKDDYLSLKSIVGPYRAEFSEVRCGSQGGAE